MQTHRLTARFGPSFRMPAGIKDLRAIATVMRLDFRSCKGGGWHAVWFASIEATAQELITVQHHLGIKSAVDVAAIATKAIDAKILSELGIEELHHDD